MKILRSVCICSVCFLTLFSCSTNPDLTTAWEHPMYLGHAGFWKQRIPVEVSNHLEMELHGDPFTLEVGKGLGQLPLKGVSAASIRVTNGKGEQLKCRVDDREGNRLESGPIPQGAVFTFPLENESGATATYYVYFENDLAWPVGEYLFTHREVSNGGFEFEDRLGPVNWELDWPQEARDVSWAEDKSHSGSRSIELVSNSSTGRRSYGATQADIHLIPGASYEVEAWFRTENLDGEAGLVLTAANLARTKRDVRITAARLSARSADNEWHKLVAEFVAPEESNVMEISTFIQGTGKIWIDDVSVRCQLDYNISAEVLPVEKLPAKDLGQTDDWLAGPEASTLEWPVRASVTVPNFTAEDLEGHPVYVDFQMLKQRLFAELNEHTKIQLTDGTDPIPYYIMGNGLLFKQDIPAFSNRTFYLYFSGKVNAIPGSEILTYPDLSEITRNLVVNPMFEEARAAGWDRFGEAALRLITEEEENGNPLIQFSFTKTGEESEVLVSDIEESHSASAAEMGLSQTFDVSPGKSYFFSAKVKTSDIIDRTFTLRAGFLNEAGELVQDKETRRANPDMHQNNEWVSESMIVEAPGEASTVKIELVNTEAGEVWYDDVYFMEVGMGYTGAMSVERKAEKDLDGLAVWEKDPLAKVFPDDLPEQQVEAMSFSAAKNDVQSLQILLRSNESYENLEVKLAPLQDPDGNSLEKVDIGIVGYVPISYPSNYIRDFVTPFWQVVLPKGTIGSDGWTGWWADPILPFSTFDLPAHNTMAAWIEVAVPEDAVPGIYKGQVQLTQDGEVLKELPLEMQVYNFTLPKENNVKATYVLRFNERKMFGRELTSAQWKDELWEYMARHRISSKMVEPEPEINMLDGEVVLDFEEFDKAAVYYFDSLKIASTWSPQFFYLFGWGRPPASKFGETPYPGEYPYRDADHLKLRPEYKRLYQSALRQYWEHMKEKGWDDKVVIYISDEPHPDEHMNKQMYAVCDMIHEVDPDIPIYVSTWWYRPEFEGYVDVWGLSHRGGGWGHPVPAEHLQEIRKNGGDIYFTTDGMQCTDSPYLGFERLLPYFCFKYEAKEYEFWASNWHTLDPYKYGWHRFHRQSPSVDVVYWMRYPNGDGNFIYPGKLIDADPLVPSIRLKQAREGVEDFEFMYLLDGLIKEGKARGLSTADAEAALKRATDLVTIPCADGRYTTEYVPDPALIMEIRHGIALSIEELSDRLE